MGPHLVTWVKIWRRSYDYFDQTTQLPSPIKIHKLFPFKMLNLKSINEKYSLKAIAYIAKFSDKL